MVIFVEDRVVHLALYFHGRHELLEQARVHVTLDDHYATVSLETHREEVAVAIDCGEQAREKVSRSVISCRYLAPSSAGFRGKMG